MTTALRIDDRESGRKLNRIVRAAVRSKITRTCCYVGVPRTMFNRWQDICRDGGFLGGSLRGQRNGVVDNLSCKRAVKTEFGEYGMVVTEELKDLNVSHRKLPSNSILETIRYTETQQIIRPHDHNVTVVACRGL